MTDDQNTPQDFPVEPPDSAPPLNDTTDQQSPQESNESIGVGGAGDAGEEVEIWKGRTHWKHYAGRLMAWIACNIALAIAVIWACNKYEWLSSTAAFWVIAGVLLISGLVVIGRISVTVLSHRYRVTSQRLFIERGILSQTVDQTELIRVDDVRLYKTVLNRVFGLGSIGIISTDASDQEILIEGVPEADKVAESIRSNMRKLRQKSLFVENL